MKKLLALSAVLLIIFVSGCVQEETIKLTENNIKDVDFFWFEPYYDNRHGNWESLCNFYETQEAYGNPMWGNSYYGFSVIFNDLPEPKEKNTNTYNKYNKMGEEKLTPYDILRSINYFYIINGERDPRENNSFYTISLNEINETGFYSITKLNHRGTPLPTNVYNEIRMCFGINEPNETCRTGVLPAKCG